MPLDPDFLAILVCPVCRKQLVERADGRLACGACRRVYPVRDDIPILLIDEAVIEEEAPRPVAER